MSTHQYKSDVLKPDYMRGGIGFGLMALFLAFAPVGSVMWYIFMALALLFGGFVVKTYRKAQHLIQVTDEAIGKTGAGETIISWNDLAELRLRAFSVRRNDDSGWLELTLGAGDKKIVIESTIDDFDSILQKAGAVALQNNLALIDTTRENLATVGIDGYEKTASKEARPDDRGRDDLGGF